MSERDMTAPVTRGELHEALDLWAGAIIDRLTNKFEQRLTALMGEMRALVKATEQNLIARMDATFDPHRGLPERVGALEQAELPGRVGKLEAKVFAPKRRARARARKSR